MSSGRVIGAPMGPTARLAWLVVLLAALLALFWPTFVSIVEIWLRSETFAHGFLVLPVVAFLIWRNRQELARTALAVDSRALPLLAGAGFLWLLARLVDVLLVEQLAVFALIVGLVWLTLGWAAIRVLAFPLGFLLFAVPMGEGLIYPLMQFTAVFTVTLLRWSGIPVFWDGTFFSIPSGDWSVVAACSGVRYLIASLFLGVLYAYLSYRSLWRRLAFIALAGIVPIIANGLRAYMIVMIGHLSDMQLAVGIDHFIYGWVFFGVVMFLMFGIGRLWVEREPAGEFVADAGSNAGAVPRVSARRGHALALAGLLVLAIWPAYEAYTASEGGAARELAFDMPPGEAGWRPAEAPLTDWEPRYVDPSMVLRQDYERSTDRVGLYLAFYGDGDGELVTSVNVMVQTGSVWRMPTQVSHSVRLAGQDRTLLEARVASAGQSLLVWHWYWIDGRPVSNSYLAKAYEALAVLTGNRIKQAGVVLYTPIGLTPETARERLQGFADDMLPAIEANLNGLRQVMRSDSTAAAVGAGEAKRPDRETIDVPGEAPAS